jgi:hypothetical protein
LQPTPSQRQQSVPARHDVRLGSMKERFSWSSAEASAGKHDGLPLSLWLLPEVWMVVQKYKQRRRCRSKCCFECLDLISSASFWFAFSLPHGISNRSRHVYLSKFCDSQFPYSSQALRLVTLAVLCSLLWVVVSSQIRVCSALPPRVRKTSPIGYSCCTITKGMYCR